MAIFSAGYLAVSCIFLLLFYRALRKRSELELTPLEVLETGVSIGASVINAATALASLAIALFAGPGYGALAGIIYPIVLCPGFTIFYTVMGRKKRLMLESADVRESESAGTPVA